ELFAPSMRRRQKKDALMSRTLALAALVVVLGSGRLEAADDAASRFAAAVESPRLFSTLTLSYETMAALDWYTTTRAIGRGAEEANPLLSGVAGHPVLFFATKAATTAATVYLARRVWKQNRVAAVAVLIAANAVTSAIVAHNAGVNGARR